METVSVDVSVTLGINGPCMTVSMEDIGVVSTVYTLRQLVFPAEETCIQRISIHIAYMLVDSERNVVTYFRKTECYNWIFLSLK